MNLDRYTVLHRKDERGVIVESGVFGPDDEIPEGFGAVDYQPIYAPREDDQEPVAESVLTQWESPIAKGTWVENRPEDAEVDDGTPLQARDELTGAEEEALAAVEQVEQPEDDTSELDEGSPRQAREGSDDGDLTGAEQEADEALADEDDESDDASGSEVDDGTPIQAREQADGPAGDGPPPQGGPGSGKEAWASYAAAQGVEVPEGATRDDIIAAVEKAGRPV